MYRACRTLGGSVAGPPRRRRTARPRRAPRSRPLRCSSIGKITRRFERCGPRHGHGSGGDRPGCIGLLIVVCFVRRGRAHVARDSADAPYNALLSELAPGVVGRCWPLIDLHAVSSCPCVGANAEPAGTLQRRVSAVDRYVTVHRVVTPETARCEASAVESVAWSPATVEARPLERKLPIGGHSSCAPIKWLRLWCSPPGPIG